MAEKKGRKTLILLNFQLFHLPFNKEESKVKNVT